MMIERDSCYLFFLISCPQLIVILSALWITQCLADYYSPVDYDSYYQVRTLIFLPFSL